MLVYTEYSAEVRIQTNYHNQIITYVPQSQFRSTSIWLVDWFPSLFFVAFRHPPIHLRLIYKMLHFPVGLDYRRALRLVLLPGLRRDTNYHQ
jgi:hypothetical protein